MSMTKEKMARFLLEEMIDDFERLARQMEELEERWCQYGAEQKDNLDEDGRKRMEEFFQGFIAKMKKAAEESE